MSQRGRCFLGHFDPKSTVPFGTYPLKNQKTYDKIRKNERDDKKLKKLFQLSEREKLSEDFNKRLMQKIVRETYRKEQRNTIKSMSLLGAFILFTLILIRFTLRYFSISIPLPSFKEQAELLVPLIAISFILILLLSLDYWLRKKFLRP